MAAVAGEWLQRLTRVCGEVASGRAGVDDVEACARAAPVDELRAGALVMGAFNVLLDLTGQVWDESSPDAGLAVLAIGGNVALMAQQVTGEATPVRVYARRLAGHGMHVAATNVLRAAVDVGGPALQGSPPLRAQLLNLLGDMLRDLGDLRGAEEALTQGLADVASDVAEPGGGEDTARDRDVERLRSALLNNLALVLQSRGELSRAADLLREVVEIDQRLGVPPAELAISIDNLGGVHREIADTHGSLWISDDLVDEAVSAELRVAESYFEQAQQLFDAALPDAADDYAISLLHSADIALLRRDAGLLDLVSSAAERVDSEHRLSRATSWAVRSMRGRALADAGRHGDAIDLLRPWFDETQGTAAAHEVPERALTVLLESASAVRDGDLIERVAHEIVEVDDAMLERTLRGSSSRSARHQLRDVHRRAEQVLGACLPAGDEGELPQWLYDLLLSRKGVLHERAGSAWLRHLAGSGDLVEQVRMLRGELATLDLDGADVRTVREARRRRVEAAERLDGAERALQGSLPDGAARRVVLRDVQSVLDDGTLLVDIVQERPPRPARAGYVGVLRRRSGAARFVRLGPVREVDARLGRAAGAHATRATQGPRPDRRLTPAAPAEEEPPSFSDLAAGLLPLGDHLGGVATVVLAPHGRWARLPIALLPGVRGEPLIDSVEVSVVPSARWLVTRHPAPGGGGAGPAVVIGDADFDLGLSDVPEVRPELRAGPLPWTHTEAVDVAALLQVEPLLRAAASRGALVEAARPTVLHVATHGTFIDAVASEQERREPRSAIIEMVGGVVVTREPGEHEGLGWSVSGESRDDGPSARHRRRVQWLREVGPSEPSTRSALLLAGFNGWLAGAETPADVGTGVVTAAELALLDLEGTGLVVLSACETGVSAVDDVDGTVLGLRTAALAAGAGCCVASLWTVDDRVTAELMTTMYAAQADGLTWPAALRAAQLAVRRHHPDPFYWAAWVAEGA